MSKTAKKVGKVEIKRIEGRSKAVSSPNAQTNNLCNTSYPELGSLEWANKLYNDMLIENEEIASIFYLQFSSGCRISEILSISYKDILRDGSVKIVGKKNSNDRIVNCSKIESWVMKAREAKKNPFNTFNRFFIHRFYKRFGVVFKSANSQKNSTTHALRQLKAQAIREIENDNKLISESLGQKNPKNANYYGKSKAKE